jgi:SagB-type dehydrogenase family enzyme
VTASPDGAGTLIVQGPTARVSLRHVPAGLHEALRRLEPPGADQARLCELIQSKNGDGVLARWYYYLEKLTQRGLIQYVAHADGTRLATLVGVSSSFVSGPDPAVIDRSYVLSRFAYLRRAGTEVVLESPLTPARIMLSDCRSAALIGALGTSATVQELAERVDGLEVDAIAGLLGLLLRAGMLEEPGREKERPALNTWEFHDLVFHAHSRKGRSDAPYGGTYRLADCMPPPPALKPALAGQAHELYRPDLEQLEREDPPLTWVQSRRRSIRDFDATRPLTDRQLGEFLYRVARVTEYREAEVSTPHGPVRQDFAARPYPAGGGLYELELYAAIQACNHLPPGLYHYDAAAHRLIRLRERSSEVVDLLRDAGHSTGTPADSIQVLLIVAARFPRVAWKYESIAYALILKHVGVLYQTMYLAATAMGLAPCAIGGGDADLFARAAGTDYYAETSVGEFLLGNPRPA